MGLVFWWMLLVWIVLIAGYYLVRYLLLRRRRKTDPHPNTVPVAHSDRLTGLPEYKAALKKYSLLLKLGLAAMTISLVMSMFLSARPAAITLIEPAQQSRDIMLCLDVSGSVLRADSRLVNRFTALVNSFTDQRFGMTVFNSSSVSVIPLTNDYLYLNEQLTSINGALASQKGQAFTDLTSGTLADFDKGTSLVSDGIVSCLNDLGENPQNRSQSIILASDNEMNGKPIIEMDPAIALAEKKNVRIYAIDPGESDSKRADDHTEFKRLAERTGGQYHKLTDVDAVASIIDDISSQEAKYASTTPVLAFSDTPKVFLYVAGITTFASLFFVWRLRI